MQFRRPEPNEKAKIRLSVRELVESVRRTGSIDERISARAEKDAMLKGAKIHRKLQAAAGSLYRSEVPFSVTVPFETYDLTVEGRADGVFTEDGTVVIDEIKGVYQDLEQLSEPVPVHLAQALCYAYIYVTEENVETIDVRLTYVQMDTEEIKRFRSTYTPSELAAWFEKLLDDYRRFTDYFVNWTAERDASMKALAFPFPYREGQKELVKSVYRTISAGRKLYLEAPTGVGKTMAVLYPAIRAVGERKAERIFYLSARGVAQAAPWEAFEILHAGGLRLKAIRITAKEKLCFMNEPSCNPDDCPYAKDYFQKIGDAVYEALSAGQLLDRETIIRIARKHEVCPYELSLDIAVWMDAVVCDYNYVFDPDAKLKRFFADNAKKENIFLIDEAHNLVDRGRSMYSASLVKEEILKARKLVRDRYPKVEKILSKINKKMLAMKKGLLEGWGERRGDPYVILPDDGGLALDAMNAMSAFEDLFDATRDAELKKELLETYFMLRTYVNISDLLDDHYVIYAENGPDGQFAVHLFCTDPSENIKAALVSGAGSIFFSATLLPIAYYRSLLGAEEEDYAVYAESPFEREHRGIFLGSDVSSRYTRRSEAEYRKIASYIRDTAAAKPGNYLIFFPSHKMMTDVFAVYRKEFEDPAVNWVVQGKYMSELDREIFLEDFEYESPEGTSLIGFCVMGGIFSEGLDLTGQRLIGAVIVGTGLPQISNEGEILKTAYEERGLNGFDYAYRYPGMNRVLQAAGRVIRTAEDVGIVTLLDERFLQQSNQKLFPREWERFLICDAGNYGEAVKAFWTGRE